MGGQKMIIVKGRRWLKNDKNDSSGISGEISLLQLQTEMGTHEC